MLDRQRFPSLVDYLESLPGGLDAYPECRSKGAVARSVLDTVSLQPLAGELPAPLAELIRSPPPLTEWIPAVHSDALFHAACDSFHPTDEAVVAWTHARSSEMARHRAYRTILGATGPSLFFRVAVRTHAFFQQGTDLSLVANLPGRVVVSFRHPPHLHSRLNQLSNVGLLRAVTELTGGRNVRCDMTVRSPEGARYECTFT